jgi:hypothetical protein
VVSCFTVCKYSHLEYQILTINEDARPDYSVHSTDFRMEVSVSAGLGHIHTFMHPQAIIVDNSGIEDEFFLRALRDRSTVLDMTLIQLPKHAGQNLLWLARLDSASLKGNEPHYV